MVIYLTWAKRIAHLNEMKTKYNIEYLRLEDIVVYS